jgi:peptidoglycan/LPS O-acetylase OafA/YrhL
MRDGEPTLRSGRNGALDAVRGIAILLVMAGHAGFPGAPFASVIGVTLFLLMSGFLITTLLADERARTGRIDLRRFIVRRSLRIPFMRVRSRIAPRVAVAAPRDSSALAVS